MTSIFTISKQDANKFANDSNMLAAKKFITELNLAILIASEQGRYSIKRHFHGTEEAQMHIQIFLEDFIKEGYVVRFFSRVGSASVTLSGKK